MGRTLRSWIPRRFTNWSVPPSSLSTRTNRWFALRQRSAATIRAGAAAARSTRSVILRPTRPDPRTEEIPMSRIVTLVLLVSLPLIAADQIVLTNGDTITGVIVKKDGAKLTVKSEFLGEVAMPWSAVKSIRGDSEVFVQLASGEIVKGKIASSGDQLQVVSAAGTKAAPMAQVAAVRDAGEQRAYERLQHPGLRDLWAGNFDLGLALARGNART